MWADDPSNIVSVTKRWSIQRKNHVLVIFLCFQFWRDMKSLYNSLEIKISIFTSHSI